MTPVVEPLLTETEDRFTFFPIRYMDIFEFYKKSQASFWTAEEVDLGLDLNDWESLSEDERTLLKHVLAFFAASDGIVCENIVANFSNEVQVAEARAAYSVQGLMEQVHSEVYSLLIDVYIKDEVEKVKLFRATMTMPTVKAKGDFAKRYMDPALPFRKRLVAFGAMEGILFSASFAAIFYFKSKGKMMGLAFANEMIARDEGLHTEFCAILYRKLVERLTDEEAHEIVKGAVEVERCFVKESLNRVLGMSAADVIRYVEYVADHLLVLLGHSKIYNVDTCPLPFMEAISLIPKSNFFEGRDSQYQLSGLMSRCQALMNGGSIADLASERVLNIDEEF